MSRYWWAAHPQARRSLQVAGALHVLMTCAVAVAPNAVAAGNGAILNFTGLHDSYGVPVGDYYLTLATAAEQIRDGGPAVTSPGSALDWLGHAALVATTSQITAAALDFQCGLFVGIITLALWIMKALTAGYWLTLIGSIAQSVTAAVIGVFTKVGVVMIAVPVGVWLGLMRIRRGEHGSGWMTVLAGLGLPALTVTVFSDPAGLMYGPGGVLDFGRRIGFSVAQSVHPGGLYSGTGFGGQVDTMTASLVTHVVREPIQLWNFGHIIDTNPGCAAGWSAAIRSGIKDAPLAAVHRCGDTSAAAYALHLDGTNIWVGGVFIVVALLIGYVMAVCGWCVLKVLIKALWVTAIITVTLWVGAIFTRRALDSVWMFFRHGIEVMTYVIYASVVGVAIDALVSRPLPAAIGGGGVFPHILMLGLLGLAAVMLLHHLHQELTGRPHATVRLAQRVGGVAAGMAISGAISGGAGAAVAGAKGLAQSHTPDDAPPATGDRAGVGEPSRGFEPVLRRDEAGVPPGGSPSPGGITESAATTMTVPGGDENIPEKIPGSVNETGGSQWLTEAEHSDMLAAEAWQELTRGGPRLGGTENEGVPPNMSGEPVEMLASGPDPLNEEPVEGMTP